MGAPELARNLQIRGLPAGPDLSCSGGSSSEATKRRRVGTDAGAIGGFMGASANTLSTQDGFRTPLDALGADGSCKAFDARALRGDEADFTRPTASLQGVEAATGREVLKRREVVYTEVVLGEGRQYNRTVNFPRKAHRAVVGQPLKRPRK